MAGDGAAPETRAATRIVVRPLGNPMPLGMFSFGIGMLLLAAESAGLYVPWTFTWVIRFGADALLAAVDAGLDGDELCAQLVTGVLPPRDALETLGALRRRP